MSNPIRFDPPLVRALAAELSSRLSGRMAHAVPVFGGDLSATLLLDRGEALRWDLHPTRGWVRIVPRPPELADRDADARIVRVGAPADERLLHLDLHDGGRFRGGRRSLVLELHTNQWNALLVDERDGRIVSVLRARDAGGRSLRPGSTYAAPSPHGRFPARDEAAAREEWMRILASVSPPERRVALLRGFAGASPVNADAILGDAAREDDPAALDGAFARWWSLASARETHAVLLRLPHGMQPYPAPLDDVEGEPFASLLMAMEAAATVVEETPVRDRAVEEALPPARRRLDAARRRVDRLRGERAEGGKADRLRASADLLMANLHAVPAGAASVTLPGFEGGEETIDLDPARRPHENAAKLYDEARRLQRSAERLPALLARAEAEAARWADAVTSLEAGEESPRWLEAALRRPAPESKRAAEAGERLPYRPYRTSGGIEVRVGRSGKDNDHLTFGHSAREDIWLHARQVAGSHVILRWTAPEAPPARDLEEAAVLAAWYSKARTSGTVAVDWTRRKHVRKPRGAPPGRVSLLQAKTLFVAPDEAVEVRLRDEPSSGAEPG